MSTGATITVLGDHGETYYLRRGHDAFPDIVMPDLERACDAANRLWDGAETGQFVARFLGTTFEVGARLHEYELCPYVVDDDYLYEVVYEEGQWRAVNVTPSRS